MIGGGALSGGIGSSISGGSFWKGFGIAATVGVVNHAGGELFGGTNPPNEIPPSADDMKAYLAGEWMNGTITRQEYLNAITLIDDGAWGLVQQVIWNNKTDIALTAGGVGLLRILSKARLVQYPNAGGYGIDFGKIRIDWHRFRIGGRKTGSDVNLPHVDIPGKTKHWPWHQLSKWWRGVK
ncbi:MAG: hypothetical protein EA409_00335 [Saprospirales bacterium]|nr:MAG: hypothetical protein EA409_00335 [Saprospirales bacterium]